MHISVNGCRLYVDIEGAGIVPDGPRMRTRPTLVLLHGGPGLDHSGYKPDFAQLAAITPRQGPPIETIAVGAPRSGAPAVARAAI